MFSKINALLREKGLMLRSGTVVDAALINAPSSTQNRRKAGDPEMHQTRKGQQGYFGMKAHIGVDADSGLVHRSEALQRMFKPCIRAKAEHPVRGIKRQFGYAKVRYRSLRKNTAQLMTLFALAHLWMARTERLARAS